VPSGESLQGEGLVWLIGAVVCLLAAYRGSSCTLTCAMDGRNLCCSTIGSCQSTANSYDCTALLYSAIEESDLYLFRSADMLETAYRPYTAVAGLDAAFKRDESRQTVGMSHYHPLLSGRH